MIEASCHCGAVRMEIAEPPPRVTSCNCSVCRRYGTLWAYYHPSQVRLIAEPGATQPYLWGDKELEFHHCATCGCVTHWEAADKTKAERVAVNMRLADPAILVGMPVRKFDGADTWTYTDE